MKVVVTGAAGFVGSHLTEACLATGWEVVAIDALTPYYAPERKRANAAAFKADPSCIYREEHLLDADLPGLLSGVDIVFHLAAQAGVRTSWGRDFDSYVDLNVTTLQRLLEAAKDANLAKFVFASSSSVYGDAERLPTPEESILRPVSPYGATKALGEHLLYLYHKSYGLPTVALRYFTVYGPRQRPDMAFHRAIDAAMTQQEFTLFGDGGQTRDFTYVADAVDATLAAGLRGTPGQIYNVGGGTRASMNQVLGIINDLTGSLRLRYIDPQRGDVRDTAADTTRASRELGWSPACGLEEGLRRQVDWQGLQKSPPAQLERHGESVSPRP